jgi:HSP20 family molecular chaperone IbpA
MTAHSTIQSSAGAPVKLVPAHVLSDRMHEIHGLIASRAYELFEKRGRMDGEALNHWLEAEDQLIHSCRHDVKESAEAFFLRAEIPGSFSPDQLEVSVEPHRLMVSGEKRVNVTSWDGNIIQEESRPRRIFRVHDLPVEVAPSKATATLIGDILEVRMPKVTETERPRSTAQAAGARK